MNHWEFLIQHENNQSWQSISKSVWTITEGKYHLVAKTDSPEMHVEIHLSSGRTGIDGIPERVQKVSSRTDSQGLLTILPLTEMVAGTLDIHCHSDLMSEMLGNSWHKKLTLEIVPVNNQTMLSDPDALSAFDLLTEMTNDEEELDLDELLEDLELSVPVIESDSTAPHVEVETTELATRPTESIFIEKKIQLTLEQESLLREAEEPITFSGIVQLDTLGEEQIEDKGLQFNGLLRLELREPSTSQVLFIWESPSLW